MHKKLEKLTECLLSNLHSSDRLTEYNVLLSILTLRFILICMRTHFKRLHLAYGLHLAPVQRLKEISPV